MISRDLRAAILALAEKGVPKKQIASRLGTNRTTVRWVIESARATQGVAA